jgi:hypothetical protein
MAKKGGQNKEFCKRYRSAGRREVNKLKKLIRHLNRQPEDGCALKAYLSLAPGYLERVKTELRKVGYKKNIAFG